MIKKQHGFCFCTGFGLACHLGVQANLPTIGIGKNVSYGFFVCSQEDYVCILFAYYSIIIVEAGMQKSFG